MRLLSGGTPGSNYNRKEKQNERTEQNMFLRKAARAFA
jgi:hypothetical protein